MQARILWNPEWGRIKARPMDKAKNA